MTLQGKFLPHEFVFLSQFTDLDQQKTASLDEDESSEVKKFHLFRENLLEGAETDVKASAGMTVLVSLDHSPTL